ncbi:MAG: NAD(P)/FAD-dependent oxidoreductase [Thermoplasmatota archaeon]
MGDDPAREPPLVGDRETEVAVVGGGAAGLAAANALADSGRHVTLLERTICGGSSTGKSAGFLTPDSELELSQLVRRFGVAGARDLWGVATRGVDLIVENVRKHGLDCDLQTQDSLFVGNDAGGWRDALAEVAARKELGYPQEVYDRDRLKAIFGGTGYTGAVRYPGTYGINPLRYAQGMKRVLLEKGVRIHESSEVIRLDGHTLTTHLGTLTAENIVFCADKISPTLTEYARRIYHAQTFLSISEPLRETEVSAMFPEAPLQCWDTDLVYTYYRLTGDRRLLVGGGSKLTTFSRNDVTTPRVIGHVIRGFKKHFPDLADLEFVSYWPGRIDTTRDLLPTVARDAHAPWVHYVLGCVGLPWATFCGEFCARHIHDDAAQTDHRYYAYFAADRRFFLPLWLERVVGKQVVFSLNNTWAKYEQVDIHKPHLAGVGLTDGPARGAKR